VPVRYSQESAGPSTRRAAEEHGDHYYEDISTTGAAAERAAELGVDLSTVTGTGKGGRITKADVEAAGEA
jgi:pyruvate/2-oxoglutarate dehydrogenase complex dihydrolipoamide acyltransferase (E2) component